MSIFWFCGCSHYLKWFWSPRKQKPLPATASQGKSPVEHQDHKRDSRWGHASFEISEQVILIIWPKLMSIESVIPSNHLILCRPLLLLPSIFPSIRVFSNESVLRIRWPKYWSFSFNISPSNEHPGLISFRMDWLHLLVVQGYKSMWLATAAARIWLQRLGFFALLKWKESNRDKAICLKKE